MSIELPNPKSEIGRMTFRRRAAIAWKSFTDSSKIALLYNVLKRNSKKRTT